MSMNRITVMQGDITRLEADAIVNPTNTALSNRGGGTDGAIHRAAGPGLEMECRKLNGCKTGKAKITGGYNLPAKFVIHTVGPVYTDGLHGEPELLASCYRECLSLAVQYGLKTIAFPCISTGIHCYPFMEACVVALGTVRDFLKSYQRINEVYMVCFTDADFSRYKDALALMQ
jgi:O-acetyl-ADP-ribose deacetylase (regulator of RNase III)